MGVEMHSFDMDLNVIKPGNSSIARLRIGKTKYQI